MRGIEHTPADRTDEAAQLRLFDRETEPSADSDAPCDSPLSPEQIAEQALDHLNDRTERSGAARFTSARAAKERIRDGASLADLTLVIDFCHALWWGDARMETYIRPKTLFGKENFPEYLVRARKWEEDGRPPLATGKPVGEDQGGYARGAEYYARMDEEEES